MSKRVNATLADAMARQLGTYSKQDRATIRDRLDFETDCELDGRQLDILTDMVTSRLRHGEVSKRRAMRPEADTDIAAWVAHAVQS